VAKIPGRDTTPGPRRLHLYRRALGAQIHGVRDIQRTLIDHGFRTNRLVRAGLDREGGCVLSVELGGPAPGPGMASGRLDGELALSD